ncbi:MAG: putative DNA binding domain-containing protein [Pseudomonadota bacterium]|nr:putative DNA binding domain-containing protein [Pseudomonadota bacterium]
MARIGTREVLGIGEESEQVEFKEQFTPRAGPTLVAFANARGGKLYLGVSDAGRVVGVEDINKLKSDIQHLVSNCQPSITVTMRKETLTSSSSKPILVVSVQEGENKPYAYNNVCFTREGTSTKAMRPTEIIALAEQSERIKFDRGVCKKFDYHKHFDKNKLQLFLKKAGLPACGDEKEVMATLDNLEVLSKAKSKAHPVFNNAGVLFFAKDLHKIFQHTEVACASYKNEEKTFIIDAELFNSDLIANVEGAMQFLRKNLRLEYHFVVGQLQRQEVLEIPEDALREALINAVTHRDYLHDGASTVVEIYTNRIEISNIGALPRGLDSKDFGKRSVPRNRLLAELMHRAKVC